MQLFNWKSAGIVGLIIGAIVIYFELPRWSLWLSATPLLSILLCLLPCLIPLWFLRHKGGEQTNGN